MPNIFVSLYIIFVSAKISSNVSHLREFKKIIHHISFAVKICTHFCAECVTYGIGACAVSDCGTKRFECKRHVANISRIMKLS